MHLSTFQSDLSPTRVLVVESSDRVKSLYQKAFVDLGCEINYARDGFEALSMANNFGPTLLFVNTQLARLDGYKFTSIITRNKRFKDKAPVVLVSHDADLFERAHGRLMGAAEHLLHPVDPEAIREAFYRNA